MMRRYEALREIAAAAGDTPIVCNLGHPSQELFALADRRENFYMLGAMGLTTSIAHGIALASATPVIAIDGDASVTMNLGGFATIAHTRPRNLIQIIIDNRANGSTGFQPSFTAGRLRLDAVARAAGIDKVMLVSEQQEIFGTITTALAERDGPYVIVITTETGMPDNIGFIPLDAQEIRDRFVTALRDRNGG